MPTTRSPSPSLLIIVALLSLAPWAGTAAASVTVDVYVFNNEFSLNPPGEPLVNHATITAGDTIRWVWAAGVHTTTSVSVSPLQWNVPITSANPIYSLTFPDPGLYWYYCLPHGVEIADGTAGGMAASITVLPNTVRVCCLPDDTCVSILPAECLDAGGTWLEGETSCNAKPCLVQPVTVELSALRDNVLYETKSGALSNGAGRRLFAGRRTDGLIRRSLLAFDVAAEIPAGSTITNVSLRLYCSQSSGAAVPVSLHPVLSAWGEGTSQATGDESAGAPATTGDATWLHRFFPDQFWTMAGGDFLTRPSASLTVSAGNSFYVWSSNELANDVQQWLNMPSMNHGWMLRGDEVATTNGKRFESRNAIGAINRPALIITYVPPPAGSACCLPDGTCVTATQAICIAQGGLFQGANTMCGMTICPLPLEPFVDALPIPSIAQPVSGIPGHAAHYEIAMTEQFQQLHRDLPPTRVWGYAGSSPGPTIEARRGHPVTVTWRNDLRVAETGLLREVHVLPVDECLHGPDVTGQTPVTVVHLHGGRVGPESDGYPEDAFPPGAEAPLYTYPNEQPAATLWYHDHALGITRLNVMMGLAGFYLIRDDDEDALGLPAGAWEIPLVIQDRSFRADGSIAYPEEWHEHFFGNAILVNGKVWPYLEVDRGLYRFRMLNGSNSRTYTLSLSNGATFRQIGSDLGLLEAPVALTEVTILPGERADVVIDFNDAPPGTEIILTNSAPAPFPGVPGIGVVPDVMKFIVGPDIGHTSPLPMHLVHVPRLQESDAVIERVLDLRLVPSDHCPEHHGLMWTIDGLMWDDITEFPLFGTTEIWTWRNESGMSHPMHIHLVKSQILNRQALDPATGEPTGPLIAPAPNEMGWKDTVDAWPDHVTRVIARFDGFTGRYAYHCHILEHEDHEMMRQFEVVAAPAIPGDLNGDGVVNLDDLLLLLGAWGPCPTGHHAPPCPADLNGDGTVDLSDLLIMLNNWS